MNGYFVGVFQRKINKMFMKTSFIFIYYGTILTWMVVSSWNCCGFVEFLSFLGVEIRYKQNASEMFHLKFDSGNGWLRLHGITGISG